MSGLAAGSKASGRGRGLSGGCGYPAAPTSHDSPVPCQSRDRDRGPVRPGPRGVRAGRVLRPALVATNGTTLTATAPREASRSAEQIAAKILAEAAATDGAE